MAEAKHTPGPWKAFKYTEPANSATGLAIGWHINQTDGACVYVTTINMVSHRAAECEANARLISAAPELLEALKLLLGEVIDSGNGDAKDYGWPDALKASRAAIAKAEGAA